MKKIIFAIFTIVSLASINVSSQVLIQPYNLSFESADIGMPPDNWEPSSKSEQYGYIFTTTDSIKTDGRKSLAILSPFDADTSNIAFIRQSVHAMHYIGKRINFYADILSNPDNEDSYAIIYINIRNANGDVIAAVEKDSIRTNDWSNIGIGIEVPLEARSINYGFAFKGSGTVFIDNAGFSFARSDDSFNSKASELSKNALPNLKSFAQIFAHIKHFFPTNKLQSIDWQKILLAGVNFAEQSKNSKEFASNMNRLFDSFTPKINISSDAANRQSFNFAERTRTHTWLHTGCANQYPTFLSNSDYVELSRNQRAFSALAIQSNSVNIRNFARSQYTLSFAVETDFENDWTLSNVSIRFEDIDGKPIDMASLDDPITPTTSQNKFTIKGIIPVDAAFCRVGLILDGDGTVSFSKIALLISEAPPYSHEIIIFDGNDDDISNWTMPNESISAGYSLNILNSKLIIKSDDKYKINTAKADDIFNLKLPNGLFLSFPTVSDNSEIDIESFTKNIDERFTGKPMDFILNENDRQSRIATLIDLYAHLYLFAPQNTDKSILTDTFDNLLIRTARDGSSESLITALNELLASIKDNNANAWKIHRDDYYVLPVILKWLDGKLTVVLSSESSKLQPQDVITEINSQPTEQFLSKLEKSIAGNNQQWKRMKAIAKFRAGKYLSSEKVKIQRGNQTPFEVEIQRSISADELYEQRPERLDFITDSVIYCDLTRTNDKEIKDFLGVFENAKAVVFDLRGMSNVSEHFLGLITDKNIISPNTYLRKYSLSEQLLVSKQNISINIKNIEKLQHLKTVFLCDERSIGLSETILSIVKDNSIAPIVGRKTAGNAGEAVIIRLPCDYSFSMTVTEVQSPNGTYLHGNGIEPDYEIPHKAEDYQSETDPAISKALEIIYQKIAR